MRNFLLGVAVGALGAYVAIKLSDEETRNKLKSDIDEITGRAQEGFKQGLASGREKAMKARSMAEQELEKGKHRFNEKATEVATRISDGLADLSEKTRPKTAE